MKNATSLIVWSVVVVVAFALAWRFGWLNRLTQYVQETREELRKCTWPSLDELWGSTVLVMISTAFLGLFTVVVELAMTWFVSSVV